MSKRYGDIVKPSGIDAAEIDEADNDAEPLPSSQWEPPKTRTDFIFALPSERGEKGVPRRDEFAQVAVSTTITDTPVRASDGEKLLRENSTVVDAWFATKGNLPNELENRGRLGRWLLQQNLSVTPESLDVAFAAIKHLLKFKAKFSIDAYSSSASALPLAPAEPPLEKPKRGRPSKVQPEEEFPRLRELHDISIRKLRKAISDPSFNETTWIPDYIRLVTDKKLVRAVLKLKKEQPKIFPDTYRRRYNTILASLPSIRVFVIPKRSIEMYLEVIGGKLSEADLLQKYSRAELENLPVLENDLVKQAWRRGLLPEPGAIRGKSDHDPEVEQMKSGGTSLGTVIGMKYGRQLDTFERGWATRFTRHGKGTAGPDATPDYIEKDDWEPET